MASVLKPFSSILNPGRLQVPTGQLQIDWTHNLANGLVCAWVPGAMYGVNIARDGLAPLHAVGLAGSIKVGMSQEGSGLDATVSDSTEGFSNVGGPYLKSTDPILTATAWTSYGRGYLVGASPNLFGNLSPVVVFSDPNASPFIVWPNVGFSNSTSTISVNTNSAGSFGRINFTNTVTVPQPFSLGVTYVAPNVQGYYNGIADGGAASAGISAPTSSATSFLDFGSSSNVNAISYCAYLWTRQLSAAEMLQLHLDPYGFLIPAEAEMQSVFIPGPVIFPFQVEMGQTYRKISTVAY